MRKRQEPFEALLREYTQKFALLDRVTSPGAANWIAGRLIGVVLALVALVFLLVGTSMRLAAPVTRSKRRLLACLLLLVLGAVFWYGWSVDVWERERGNIGGDIGVVGENVDASRKSVALSLGWFSTASRWIYSGVKVTFREVFRVLSRMIPFERIPFLSYLAKLSTDDDRSDL